MSLDILPRDSRWDIAEVGSCVFVISDGWVPDMRLARSASAADLLPEDGADFATASAGEDVAVAPSVCKVLDEGRPLKLMSPDAGREDGAAAAAGLFRLPVLIPESIVLLLSSLIVSFHLKSRSRERSGW